MSDISRRTALAAAGLAVAIGSGAVSRAPAAKASVSYDPAGAYLDYDTRGDIGAMSNTRLDESGVIQVARGSGWVHNPVTISQYGLQQFGYHLRSGERAPLSAALRQAGWLFTNQDRATGIWSYDYPFSVGAMSETLPSGWGSAMAQGQAISLLTRIARLYPNSPNYLAAARRAIRPLSIAVADGGFLAFLDGLPHYEEYPTRTGGCFALNGFQFTLVGLHDMRTMGEPGAESLYRAGINTLRYQLPRHDAHVTSAYHLGHLTKPLRKIHHADHYHVIHVMLLDTINAFDPSPETRFYADLWRSYPAMNKMSTMRASEDPLIGPGVDPSF